MEIIVLPFESLDGFCVQMNADYYDIGINSKLSLPRQRFTLAHEFKHFLHQEASTSQNGNLTCDEAVFGMENDANDFAGRLLVNSHYLMKYRQMFGVRELSNIFQVTESVIRIRLVQIDKEKIKKSHRNIF